MPNSERSASRRFDHDYGVTTHAILFLTDLDPEHVGDAGAHATHYEAVPVGDFRALISELPMEAIVTSTFVDVGAGMGRAVLLAAEYPFKQVTGIELSPGLYEVARENLERADRSRRTCRDVRLVRGDARSWSYPPGNLVVFLYNPFDGEAMRATLGSILHRRNPGTTWLLYHTPVERDIIESDPNWQLTTSSRSGLMYRHD
ncbi:MAG: methyltransferase domain-containing protein [Candidatus Eremiobacteraeota bacterium]|nr:methyltransferase domain-containing protein [Candidatus Eremiobacteraeota bacterium]